LKGWIVGIDTSLVKHKELDEVENKLLTTQGKLKVAHQALRVATDDVTTAQANLDKQGAAIQAQLDKTAAEINNLTIAFNHHKAVASDVEIVTPVQINNMLKGIAAAHSLGITLKSDLVQAYTDARKAQWDFANSGIQDEVVTKQLSDAVVKASQDLKQYGTVVDQFKLKSHGMWKQFKDDAKDGATALDHTKQLGVTAFDDMARGFEGAIAAVVLGQGSFVQALEKATAAALASLAAQAIVKALFYTAEGVASEFTNPPAAANYFSAAAIMGAVGAAAGLAGHALAGASGGSGGNSSSLSQRNNTVSNTSATGPSSSPLVSVQHFAEGGLISAPTLAMMGEGSKREAVIPLEDPQATSAIRDAIGGDGGTHIHVEIKGGVIAADTISKVCEQINKRVNRGQAHLLSSNTLRITKRSA
jgi:hypothetical protein